MILYEGKHFNVCSRNNWEFVERKNITGIVGIIAITLDKRLVLIQQYREPLQKEVIEIPAGLVGDKRLETIEDAAQRELREETGYLASQTKRILEFPLSPGLVSEIMTLVLATGLQKVDKGGGDESENIKVIEIPLLAATQILQKWKEEGKMLDAKVFVAVYFGYQHIMNEIRAGRESSHELINKVTHAHIDTLSNLGGA